MKVLLTAVGKRVQLIKHLKKTFMVVGTDCSSLAAAAGFVDGFYKVPRYDEEGYIDRLKEICRKEEVRMIIPLYEKEFELLCNYRNSFRELGIEILLSSESVIETFNNKIKTFYFFKENNIPTPDTYTKEEITNMLHRNGSKALNYPLILKPVDGMGSSNVFKIKDGRELSFFIDYVENPIIQEYISGTEYTIDVFCDLQGRVISAIPRERIEVRSGEVSKTRAVKNNKIINEVINLCSKTKFIGPITIQCIENDNGIKFIEVNPRLGGGVPLTFECGVDYGNLIENLIQNKVIEPVIGQFEEKIMLRYDEAVFI